jgi:hypothetical protein
MSEVKKSSTKSWTQNFDVACHRLSQVSEEHVLVGSMESSSKVLLDDCLVPLQTLQASQVYQAHSSSDYWDMIQQKRHRVEVESRAQSVWLAEVWETARTSRREALWHSLPERVLEMIEDDNRALVLNDARFLARRATDLKASRREAGAALRLIGILVEAELAPRDELLPWLIDALELSDSSRRLLAVEALWQAAAREAVPHLQSALDREADHRVRDLIKHVLGILR